MRGHCCASVMMAATTTTVAMILGCAAKHDGVVREPVLVVPPLPRTASGAPSIQPVVAPEAESPLKTYEQALAENDAAETLPLDAGVDLTDAQLSAPMRNATFVNACGAPASMKLTVRVAVKNGHAIGVTVRTNPSEPTSIGDCVDRRIRELTWPSSLKMDSFTVTY